MEWMDSAMVTRLLFLSHIVSCADASIFGRDRPQYIGECQNGELTENLPMGPDHLRIRHWCSQDIVP